MIFLIENSEIQRKEEPWKIFKRYLLNGLYFMGESYKTRSYYETLLISTSIEFQHFLGYNTSENIYNFSKMIIKQIIPLKDWAFNKVLYYNNERHKHTWFIKVCAKIFANPIPNWFLNWWSYHGPMIKNFARSISQNFMFPGFINGLQKWISLKNKSLVYIGLITTIFGIN
ncbi:hypothetical protein H5410_041082 [Solanum commersonii]|uniref:Uncharacterized protein n=1 Tax=Solanum commersonii TaxID=4109 RepID=A0A9J5XTT6_SOLCO|nr:hypothetical protein H5410_041082 [Solanum commersonii]